MPGGAQQRLGRPVRETASTILSHYEDRSLIFCRTGCNSRLNEALTKFF